MGDFRLFSRMPLLYHGENATAQVKLQLKLFRVKKNIYYEY